MLVDELRKVSESLRSIFIPRKKDQYDWKELKLENKLYFFDFVNNFTHGFQTSLYYDNFTQSLKTFYNRNEIIFKKVQSENRKSAIMYTIKLFEDKHFYKYLDWNEKQFIEYIMFLKAYAVKQI